MMIAGKSLKEHLWPIKYYIIIAVLVVVSQYYVALPLRDNYPFLINLTQGLWAIMVILSVFKLVKDHDFGIRNMLVVGIFYCFLIHGLKAFFFRVFLFPYAHLPAAEVPAYLMGKFLYGSFLVMVIVLVLGLFFIYLRNKNLLEEFWKK